MNDTQKKLYDVIAKMLKIPVEEVNDDLAIGSIPQWDSLAHVQLILEIETAFEMQFEMDELMDVEDVGDLLEIVEKK